MRICNVPICIRNSYSYFLTKKINTFVNNNLLCVFHKFTTILYKKPLILIYFVIFHEVTLEPHPMGSQWESTIWPITRNTDSEVNRGVDDVFLSMSTDGEGMKEKCGHEMCEVDQLITSGRTADRTPQSMQGGRAHAQSASNQRTAHAPALQQLISPLLSITIWSVNIP